MMKPLGQAFIALLKMMLAPIVFVTLVHGLTHVQDMRKLGRLGVKSLIYFEVVSTGSFWSTWWSPAWACMPPASTSPAKRSRPPPPPAACPWSTTCSASFLPAGYSFNLDGTAIYMAIAIGFIAQATDTPFSLMPQRDESRHCLNLLS